jgi:hypothetical protein
VYEGTVGLGRHNEWFADSVPRAVAPGWENCYRFATKLRAIRNRNDNKFWFARIVSFWQAKRDLQCVTDQSLTSASLGGLLDRNRLPDYQLIA